MLTEVKGEVDNNAVLLGAFHTPLLSMNRSSKKINKEISALNDTSDHTNLIDMYRTFHLKTAEYTFFFKWTQAILQDKSKTGAQNKS